MIIVFARAPVLGRVKTRLVPALGEWRTLQLHRRLLCHALRTALATRCGPVEVHATARHSLLARAPALRLQRGADLGERMHHAFTGALRRHRRVLLIGTDSPALAPRDLRRADRLLRGGCDAVVAPAHDGGYALIGLRKPSRALFEGIAWGGPEVYAQTRERLERLALRWRPLRAVPDVDRPADLAGLRWLRFRATLPRAARR
jgi:rSAM/selenodomain-associated transferase 1